MSLRSCVRSLRWNRPVRAHCARTGCVCNAYAVTGGAVRRLIGGSDSGRSAGAVQSHADTRFSQRSRREYRRMAGDLILTNGHLITSDPALPVAEAVAIRNGIIAVVGTNADALAERRAGTDVIDLNGRTATAAFNDAHCHPMHVGFSAAAINARPEATASI